MEAKIGMGKLHRIKKYEAALDKICRLYDDWAADRITVVLTGETDGVTSFALDEIHAILRNYALAGLGCDELVPGTPEQHFPVLVTEDRSNLVPIDAEDEPEGY